MNGDGRARTGLYLGLISNCCREPFLFYISAVASCSVSVQRVFTPVCCDAEVGTVLTAQTAGYNHADVKNV